jgi:hypothetical protein
MISKCHFDFDVDPAVADMDAATFRQFVGETCVPVFWETLNRVKSRADLVDPLLDDQMRGGEASVSCSADSHGNASCTGSVSIRW